MPFVLVIVAVMLLACVALLPGWWRSMMPAAKARPAPASASRVSAPTESSPTESMAPADPTTTPGAPTSGSGTASASVDPSGQETSSLPGATMSPRHIDGYRMAAEPTRHTGSIAVAVLVEDPLADRIDAQTFAQFALNTLNDTRGWGGRGYSFQLATDPAQADVFVRLARPATVDKGCWPLRTNGYVSCQNMGTVWLNVNRWDVGVPHIEDLTTYRRYLVSHEVGHYLGFGHVGCPGPGRKAPVMMQQTLRLDGCLANPWANET